jgi:hypothetical protein
MSDLPRRPIRPLPAPAGSFDETVRRGRARRRRTLVSAASAGLAAIAVVAIVGANSLAHVGAQNDVRPVLPIASSSPPSPAPPSSAAPASASATPSTAAPSSASPSITAPVVVSPPVSSPPPVVVVASPPPSAPASLPPPTYRGRLVDAAHHPLKGYYLYWDTPGRVTAADAPDDLTLDHPAATTRADGTFDVDCTTGTSWVVAISRVRIPLDALSSPSDSQTQHQVDVTYTGVNSILPTINMEGLCDAASRQGTLYQPHAIVMGTLLIDGKPYSAADAARAATVQPGDAGSDLFLTVEFNTPDGARMMDGVRPAPGTGAFTLSGLAAGDVFFGVALSSANLQIVDGQIVKVVVSITTGAQPTGGDATVSVTVVP